MLAVPQPQLSPLARSRCQNGQDHQLPVCQLHTLWISQLMTRVAENDLDNSSEEDMSVEVISPPRRPVTRSVSAKRAADEMEPGENDTVLISSSPRPKKVRRIAEASGMFAGYYRRTVADPLTEPLSNALLFLCSQTPEVIEGGSGVSDATGIDESSLLDTDYFERENPWKDIITYF